MILKPSIGHEGLNQRSRFMDKCLRFFIDRPLATNLFLVMIIAMAILQALKIERLGYPQVDMNQVKITTIYQGATPLDVELNITVKIEEKLGDVEGIKFYTSKSAENLSQVQVFLDRDAQDPEKTKQQIRDAIDSISDFPADLEHRPSYFEMKIQSFPVYEVALIWSESEDQLRREAEYLKKKVLLAPGVARVSMTGYRDREFQILLDLRKMRKKKVSFEEVINAIKENKIRVSGGVIESYISQTGIITLSEFQTPGEVENIIIRSNYSGRSLQIKDVGRVIDTYEKREMIVRYNGKRGIGLWVFKQESADAITTVDRVKKIVATYKDKMAPKEMSFTSTMDFSVETRTRLNMVFSNTFVGFILVLAILFFFFNRKMAFWTAMGIPISIGMSLIVLHPLGITINSISLCGLIVVLGMVVDDAIIIVESIYRARGEGHDFKEASIIGLKRVMRPIMGTIMTTILAFVPIYFVPGMIGDFGKEIPTIVIVMLLASVIEAFFFLPAHLAHEKKKKQSGSDVSENKMGDKIFVFLEKHYKRVLGWVLNHQAISATLLLITLGIAGRVGLGLTKFTMFPAEQAEEMFLFVETKKDGKLEVTDKESRKIEKMIEALSPEVVKSYRTVVGEERVGELRCRRCFYFKIVLTPAGSREMNAIELVKHFRTEIDKLGTFKRVETLLDSGGPPVGQPIEIQVLEEDSDKRAKVLTHVEKTLKNYPLEEVQSDYRLGSEEIQLRPNYKQLAKTGLNVSQVARTIRTAFEGHIVSYLQTPREKIPFRVMLDENSKKMKDPFKEIFIPNKVNALIPLNRLVIKNKKRGEVTINHYDGDRSNQITASLKEDSKMSSKEIYSKLKKEFESFEVDFPGSRIILKGEAQESYKTFWHLGLAFLAAVMGIYFVLVLQFNSLSQPFMVILSIPFGLAGVGIIFGLHGMHFSFMSLLGIVGFTGVVVNDSLVMVDFINRLRDEEKLTTFEKLKEKIIKGANFRLRPIALTTMTTLAGLLPSGYAVIGQSDIFISPMVLAMGWGLLFGTMAVLIIIPLVYALNWRFINWFSGLTPKS